MASRDLPEPKAPGSPAFSSPPSWGLSPSDQGENDQYAGGEVYKGVRPNPNPAGGIKAH